MIAPFRLSGLSIPPFIFFFFLLFTNGTVLKAQGKLISLPEHNLKFRMPGSQIEKKEFKIEGKQFHSFLHDDTGNSGTQFCVWTLESKSTLADSNVSKRVEAYMTQQYTAKGETDFLRKKRPKTYLNGFPVYDFSLEERLDAQSYRVYLKGKYVHFDEKILCWFVYKSVDKGYKEKVEEMKDRFLESLSTLGNKPPSDLMPDLLKLSPFEGQVDYRFKPSQGPTYFFLEPSGDKEQISWKAPRKSSTASKAKLEQFTYEGAGRASGEFDAFFKDFRHRYRDSYGLKYAEIINDHFLLNGVETRVVSFGSPAKEKNKNKKFETYTNLILVIQEKILVIAQFKTKKKEPHEQCLELADQITLYLANDSGN